MTESADAVPAETRVGRVALTVTDLAAVTAFYRDAVGLRVLERGEESAVLGTREAPLLELHADPDAHERGRDEAGLFHVAFRVPSRPALADALVRLREEWRLTGASDHRVSEALYCSDPEGNGVEVYCDRPESEWPTADGRVRMDTLPLDVDALADEATGAQSVPDETDVGHVHLEATSLADARAFYVDALGLRVRQEWNGDALFLAAGDYHHHVGANTWRGRTAPARGRGLDWFEFVFPDDASREAAVERVEAAGWSVERGDEAAVATAPDDVRVRLRSE